MLNNPYVQVALTYLRRPFSSWRSGIASLFTLVLLYMSFRFATQDRNQNYMFLLMAFTILSMSATIHVVQQFTNPRARLMPGFRQAHLAMAAAAALTIGILLPAVVTWLVGLRSMGLVGVTMLLFGLIAWLMLEQPAWVGLIMAGWVLASNNEIGRNCMQQIVSGQFELQAVGLIVVGAVVSLLAGIRLIGLNEEMPQYERIRSTIRAWENRWTQQRWSGEGNPLPGFRHWLLDKQMAIVTRHAQRATPSLWSRICRWQVGMLAGWQVLPWVLGMALMLLFVTLSTGGKMTTIGFSYLFLAFFPGFVAMGAMVQRTRTMNYDLCMPVDRKAYLKQLGAAAALGQFQLWLGINAIAVAWSSLAAGQQSDVADVARVLAVSALVQVWFFGLGVWLSRYGSMSVIMVATVMGIVFAQVIMVFSIFVRGPTSQWQSFELPIAGPIAGLFAVFGALFTYDAYRRWLVADLD